MSQQKTIYLDILIPGRLQQLVTYTTTVVHRHKLSLIGYRVVVPLRETLAVGIIIQVHYQKPSYLTREILAITDDFPLLKPVQIDFLRWMAKYYLSNLSTVIRTALSPLLPLLRITLRLTTTYHIASNYGLATQKLLHYMIKQQKVNYKQAGEILGRGIDPFVIIQRLVKEKVINVVDQWKDILSTEKYITLSSTYSDKESIQHLLDLLASRPKQRAVVNTYLKHINLDKVSKKTCVMKKEILAQGISPYSLHTLIKKKIFVLQHKPPFFDKRLDTHFFPTALYNKHQITLNAISNIQKKYRVLILKGENLAELEQLTLTLALKNFSQGQLLYLVPTIKQIKRLLSKLKNLVNIQVSIYHSSCTNQEKMLVWQGIYNRTIKFVIGTSSAIFLPFQNLKYIIVTEEQDEAYKQNLKKPHYHTRDAAIVLAQKYDAHVYLTSLAPSCISYYHAIQNKYGLILVGTSKKPFSIPLAILPNKKKSSNLNYQLSPTLIHTLQQQLSNQQPTIIIHSRKGYAAYTQCQACNWQATCIYCNTSLTYHYTTHQLHCHHCSYTLIPPSTCPKCTSPMLQYKMLGTQQVEELLNIYIPTARIKRLDADIHHRYAKYQNTLEDFKKKHIDILVATPAIINLLPIGSPCLVVVLDIAFWLKKPTFNACHKTYQTLNKLCDNTLTTGLILQINNQPQRSLRNLIHALQGRDFASWYQSELNQRKTYGYPPYVRLVRIYLLDPDQQTLNQFTNSLTKLYQDKLSINILGPTIFTKKVSKKRYTTQLWLKIPKNHHLATTKQQILDLSHALLSKKIYKHTSLNFDVDP